MSDALVLHDANIPVNAAVESMATVRRDRRSKRIRSKRRHRNKETRASEKTPDEIESWELNAFEVKEMDYRWIYFLEFSRFYFSKSS